MTPISQSRQAAYACSRTALPGIVSTLRSNDGFSIPRLGRGAGVGRDLGVTLGLAVGVGLAVVVGVAVGVTLVMAVGVGVVLGVGVGLLSDGMKAYILLSAAK